MTRRVAAAIALACSVGAPLSAAAPADAGMQTLRSSCARQDAADGSLVNGARLPIVFCDDGVPHAGGTTPNAGAVDALPVPERYNGYAGLPRQTEPRGGQRQLIRRRALLARPDRSDLGLRDGRASEAADAACGGCAEVRLERPRLLADPERDAHARRASAHRSRTPLRP